MKTTSFRFPDTGLRGMEDLSFQSPCSLLTGLGSVDTWSLHRAELVRLPRGSLSWPTSVDHFCGPLIPRPSPEQKHQIVFKLMPTVPVKFMSML